MFKKLIIIGFCVLYLATGKVLANDSSFIVHNTTQKSEKFVTAYDWTNYINNIQSNLRSNWFPIKENQDVEVTFTIGTDGKYKNLKVTKPSSNISDNKAAIEAVMYTAPFIPVPEFVDHLVIKYKFSSAKKGINNLKSDLIQVFVVN